MINMSNKKKIIFYLDWTDCLAHLTGDDAYSEGETSAEKRKYTRNQVNRFFKALRKLKEKYDVEIHCITGGSQEYLNGNGNGWISLIHELFINEGFPDVFKSVVTEYGADLLVGPNVQLLECPYEDSKKLCTNQLLQNINDVVPEEIKSMVELSFYKYFANIRFLKDDLTDEEFNYYYEILKEFKNNELYTLYPYYCPGYGVEIDVLPNGLDKTRAVESINEYFYKDTKPEDIALSVFNGDFHQIDLRMVDSSLTNDVLFVGSEDADISSYIESTDLPYRNAGHKIEAISMVMEELADVDLEKHPYDKGGYQYAKQKNNNF